jgi:ketosteroid isomerase-like protein
MVSGKAAIQAWFQRALARVQGVRIVPMESTAEKDQAFQVGAFTTGAGGDAASAAQAGKYILVLKQQAGRWKIQYDIWSLDQPTA